MRHRPLALSVAATITAMSAAFAAQSAPASAAATPAAMTTLSSDVIHQLGRFSDLGPVDRSQPIYVGVGLARPDAAGEAAYMKAEYDPSSASYHHFLTPEQFQSRFGVPMSRYLTATRWLQSGGLRVQTVTNDTDYLMATGSAAQIEKLFSVRIDRIRADGKTYYANVDAPSVPSSLDVLAVTGLDNIQGPRLFTHPPLKQTKAPAKSPADIGTGTCAAVLAVTACLSDPKILDDVYDAPASDGGNGESMAIFGWDATDDKLASPPDNFSVQSDLTAFEEQNNLPAITLDINHYGQDPLEYSADDTGEWHLDTQSSTGMAPDVTGETMYMGNQGTDADVVAAYANWVSDETGPMQGSSSFGGCEDTSAGDTVGANDPTGLWLAQNPNQNLYEEQLSRAVAEGKTMFASTGDTASGCPLTGAAVNGATPYATPLLNYPAVSPYVVAVGGTILDWTDDSTAGDGSGPFSRAFEEGWEFGGGGPDLFEPAPAYQSSLTLSTPCVLNRDGTPNSSGTQCRSIPDVAAQSGDNAVFESGYNVIIDGASEGVLGTSLSSPLWLGTWARVNAVASGTGLGFANNTIYKLGSGSTGTSDFFDEGGTSGQTTVTCNGAAPAYCTRPGYDYVTGWGSPDITALAKDATGNTSLTPTNNTTPAAVPVPGAAGSGPSLNPCAPLMTDATGDEMVPNGEGVGYSNAAQDIVGGAMALSPDGSDLVATLTIADLSVDPSAGAATDYVVDFTDGGAYYYTDANVDENTGAVTYSYGTADSTYSAQTTVAAPSGSFKPGTNGTISVDVPLSALKDSTGAAATSGTVLSAIAAWTGTDVGAPGDTPGTGGLGVADFYDDHATASYDYAVGQTCAGATLPESPSAAALLLVGLLAAGSTAVAANRRRRRAEA